MRQEWVGRRQVARTRVRLRAEMRFGSDKGSADCTVTDISPTGACVVLPDDSAYPDDFEIFIPARSEVKAAHVRWREKRQVGVEFTRDRKGAQEPVNAQTSARLSQLELRLTAIEGRLSSSDRAVNPAHEISLEDLRRRFDRIEQRFITLEHALALQSGSAPLGSLGDSHSGGETGALRQRQDQLRAEPDMGEVARTSRLDAIEAAIAETRASLRALILLTSAHVMRAKA